ncbi:probable plastid-lipid-associated protein 12, chloroplastic isoform X3 [Brachypodium distachyon]|nr:probable plastid-lipid-associated protein 12, chloroplastic isoform X3 [Brachypodium distachyon]|eukprot:XP_024310334.1 probable plastid-lipid-associated protein 12, chloroplastic isoform X3 [Brachypodium distachyon]
MAAAAAAAAASAATTGSLLNPRPSRSPPPSTSPLLGTSCGWRSRRQPRPRRRLVPLLAASPVAAGEASYTEPEEALLEALVGVQGRGRAVAPRQLQEVESAVQTLEAMEGVADPTSSSLIEGSWKLIFTTRPGTASPIQRTFVGVDSFRVFQEVYLRTDDPRVVNVVKFSETVGELAVQAEATIKDGKRILFRFDRAAFTFKFLPFKVPYPVPFRLLGDEAKGWLDTTYLSHSGNIRISRGNKLSKTICSAGNHICSPEKCRPKANVVVSYICKDWGKRDELTSIKKGVEADLNTLAGEWQLLWASQTEGGSWSSVASAGLRGLQTIKEDGQLKNLVKPFPGVSLNAKGNVCKIGNNNTFSVLMNEGAVQVGGVQFPLDIGGDFVMEIL